MTVGEETILNFIIEFKHKKGYAPTLKEISIGINSFSLSYIRNVLESLQEKELIRYEKRKPRTIVILHESIPLP